MRKFNIIFISVLSVLYAFSLDSSSLDYLNRILSETDLEIQKSIERTSSGTFLLTDDPAAFALFEVLEGHIRELAVNVRNTDDLISYYKTKDGYLTVIIDTLQNIRELILRMSSGILGNNEKEIIKGEIDSYYDSIIKTLKRAEFNTNPIFSDLFNAEEITEWFSNPRFYLLSSIDNMLDYFIYSRSETGAILNSLASRSRQYSSEKLNALDFESRGDTDIALEISRLQKNRILFLANLLLLPIRLQ